MTTVTDPVCGKQFENTQAVAEAEHDLHTYFFCSEDYRSQFEASPEQYSAKSSPPTCAACGGSISQDDLICPHCGMSLAAG
jgi:YHS domain-containing protein